MTLAQIQALTLTRLGDDGTYYPGVSDAINEGQRLFCLISLCLETQESIPLTGGQTFYNLLPLLPTFVLARRFFNSAGQQLRPSSIAELEALDTNWMNTQTGPPTRYVLQGLDFLTLYPQPPSSDTLIVTHVRPPVALVNLTDVPEIRPASHWALASYAAWAVRQVEGGQEMAKFEVYLQEFLDEATEMARLVKLRTPDASLDTSSFELSRVKR